jgi:hypothetical protein
MERVLKGLNKANLSQWRCMFCRRLMFFYGISPKQIGVEKEKCGRCGKINDVLILDSKAYPVNEKINQKILLRFRDEIQRLRLTIPAYSDILRLIK